MAVKRIVANIRTTDFSAARAFYGGILEMEAVMDHGWFLLLAGDGGPTPQLGFATEGGSGTAVPDLSIEVDDVDAVLARCTAAGIALEYGPVDQPWGVRRFFVRDPFGRLVNILAHA